MRPIEILDPTCNSYLPTLHGPSTLRILKKTHSKMVDE